MLTEAPDGKCKAFLFVAGSIFWYLAEIFIIPMDNQDKTRKIIFGAAAGVNVCGSYRVVRQEQYQEKMGW